MAKKKNSANYRISGAPSTSSLVLPLALSSDEYMTISTLETMLWDAACAIRGATDAPKFKDFILPLIFYKRLSDVFDDECQQYVDHLATRNWRASLLKKIIARGWPKGTRLLCASISQTNTAGFTCAITPPIAILLSL